MEDKTQQFCQFCNKEKFKYTCPKCNQQYCSLACYKSPGHLKCSEDFYKSCIREELTTAQPNSREDMQKIYDILKRIRETDAGVEPENFNDGLADSDDDDQPEECDEDDEEDIATRLQGIDINDANEVWDRLTESEQSEFQTMVDSGDIMKLLPDYKPWWTKRQNSKIVEIPAKQDKKEDSSIPHIAQNIPKFANICSKTPSPCLHYNLWNIIGAYACVVRFFGGEHLTNPSEASSHLVNLSVTLKYGTNFEDVEDAIISVEMEALSTGNGTTGTMLGDNISTTLVESREQLQSDARQLMSKQHYKLAALSDLLNLMKLAKQQSKNAKGEQADFQKLFALCSGSVELNYAKLQQIVKKIDFLLAYVNREEDNDLK